MSVRVDWPGLMRAGMGALRLRPAEFWALTPVELALMLGLTPGAGGGPMARRRMEELAALYPDLSGPGAARGSLEESNR